MANDVVLGWLDPSIRSRNSGDQIIADAVSKELTELLPNITVLRIPTQNWLNRHERNLVAACDHFLVGGTNILNGNIPRYMQWKLDPHLIHMLAGKTSLLGVGWWQYNNPPNSLSRSIWRSLVQAGVNSVRDVYTATILDKIRIPSINTSCVTMWNLPKSVKFSPTPREKVVMTVTDYHRDPVEDFNLLHGLKKRYNKVVAWPQSERDKDYLRALDRDVVFLKKGLEAFNEILSSGEYDFVGTRLHAGIRALQMNVKTTIVAVDNRAPEIAKTTGLPIVNRKMSADDWQRVEDRNPLHLQIPHRQVDEWRSQFVEKIVR